MTSHMRLPHATPSCDSYGRTDGRTNEESWLSTGEILTFRNAHAHIRGCLALVRSRADAEAAS